MLNKMHMMKNRETGFTLIELLTVIIIIGVLAAIAIPVFSAQRSRAQDSQTVSDVRNIVTAAETYLADRTKSAGDITGQAVLEYASSKNVLWDIKGNNATNGYCIAAYNASGKDYKSTSTLLTYDSTAGGLKKVGGSCGAAATGGSTGTNGSVTPTPTSSTAVGSLVVVGGTPIAVGQSKSYSATSGYTGTLSSLTFSDGGTYKIEAAGARGGQGNFYTYRGYAGPGAYASGTFVIAPGTTLEILPGNMGASAGQADAGGGGSFVAKVDNGTKSPLVVAGGGGGASFGNGYFYNSNSDGMPGSLTTSGTTRGGGTGGTGGNGGTTACSNGYCGSAGGGWLSAGASSGTYNGKTSTGGRAYLSGGNGGRYTYTFDGTSAGNSDGGFGGGGAGVVDSSVGGGAGGGGYSGGAGGGSYDQGGGGGGSYVDASTTATELNNTSKANYGGGYVTITRIS